MITDIKNKFISAFLLFLIQVSHRFAYKYIHIYRFSIEEEIEMCKKKEKRNKLENW